MGTYGSIYGEVDIPPERLPELTERMVKVMDLGGMMDYDICRIFGKELLLLKPLTLDSQDSRFISNYCYFDPFDFWEPAGFNAATGEVFSNKIGSSTFNGVVMAMYTLLEFYSRKICLARLDGQFFDATLTIGWFNHIFGEHYSAGRVCHPWQVTDDGASYPEIADRVPVEPVSSEQFLRTTPDERAYWWREGGDIHFTPDMCRWLGELRLEFNKIIACPGPVPASCEKILVSALARAQKDWGVFFFASAFDEFMAHAEHRNAQAAIVLLNRLLDGYAPGGEYLNREGWVWSTPYSRFNDNFGKYAIKLYFAVLANPELRQKVFNF